MNKLLPCPYCGSTDIKLYAFDIAPECSAECQKCGACVCDTVSWRKFDTVKSHDKRCWKKLIKKWNMRTSTKRDRVAMATDKDNEIIEAIERCATGSADDCNLCEFQGSACRAGLISQIYNLINHYKLENEKQRKTENDADETIKAQAAEIERLQKECICLEEQRNAYKDIVDTCETGAIKEFAERLKSLQIGLEISGESLYYVPIDCIDNLIKEMTERGDSK